MTRSHGAPQTDAQAIANLQVGDQKLALVIEYRWFGEQFEPLPTGPLPELEGMAPVLVLEDWPNAQPRDDGVYKSSQARDGGVLQSRYLIYAPGGAKVKRGELLVRQQHDYMYHFRDNTVAVR